MGSPTAISTRTVSADPGLLSNEELLKQIPTGKRRRTLEALVARESIGGLTSSTKEKASMLFQGARTKVRWFIEHAQIKISVSYYDHSIKFTFLANLTYVLTLRSYLLVR